MAEDWAKTIAKKVEARVAEEAERVATRRKRYDEGVERFRKLMFDLVGAVNENIENAGNRIQLIVLDNGITLSAGYKRIVSIEEVGPTEGVPASVGRITLQREDRLPKLAVNESEELYITSSGTQTTFYRRPGGQLKIMGDADFRQIIEYFAT